MHLKWAAQGFRGVRTGIFCEDYPSLKDRQISKIETEFPRWLGKISNSGIHGMSFQFHPRYGGGLIALRNLDDPSKFASSEFAAVSIDEVTKNPPNVFDQLRSIIRWRGISDTKMLAAGNPGGIGHEWVKRKWILREFEPTETEAHLFHFIQAFARDNKHLDPNYVKQLEGLPEALRKAFLEGSWELFEGQFFSEWRDARHVCAPFAIPSSWWKFRSIDHGRTAPTSCHWYAVDHDGVVYAYREYYMAGQDADVNAHAINELSQGETYRFSVLDSACFAKTGAEETIAEIYERNGVRAMPSPKDRKAGWALVHEYLRWQELVLDPTFGRKRMMEKAPKLQFFSTCTNAIRTIPALVYDKFDPEDLDTDGEDHCFHPDTQVMTDTGWHRIEDMQGMSGKVMNWQGQWVPYRNARKTRRDSELVRVTFDNGASIICTPDHRFLDEGIRWHQAIDLEGVACHALGLCHQGKFLPPSRSLTGSGIISAGNTSSVTVFASIVSFGRRLTERFQRAFMFTIEMNARRTMLSRICSFFQRLSILVTTCLHLSEERSLDVIASRRPSQPLEPGMPVQPAKSGIVRMAKQPGKIERRLRCAARCVAWNIRRLFLQSPNTVIPIARPVRCVGVERLKERSDVYCLTVEGFPAFLVQGGLIVHNSADDLRYGLAMLRESKPPSPDDKLTAILNKAKQASRIRPGNLNKFYGNRHR